MNSNILNNKYKTVNKIISHLFNTNEYNKKLMIKIITKDIYTILKNILNIKYEYLYLKLDIYNGKVTLKNDITSLLNIEKYFNIKYIRIIKTKNIFKLKYLKDHLFIKLKNELLNKLNLYCNYYLYNKFHDKIGNLLLVKIISKSTNCYVTEYKNKYKMILLFSDIIPNDNLLINKKYFVIIKKIKWYNNEITIFLSRKCKKFVIELLNKYIPKINDGTVNILNVSRVPGIKSKIVISSNYSLYNPIGLLVGTGGKNIKKIVKYINNEVIDIIEYTNNFYLFISRVLKINDINNIIVNNDNKQINVSISKNKLGKVIGKNGINIKLANKLINYNILCSEK